MLYSVVEKHSTTYPSLALLPRIRSVSTYPHLALVPRIRGASSCRANRFMINTGDCDVYHVTSIVGVIRRIAETVTCLCTHELFLLWYSDFIFVMNGFDIDRVRVFVSSAAPPYSVRCSGGSERQASRTSSTSGLPSRFQNTGVSFEDLLAAPPTCFILARIAITMRALNFAFRDHYRQPPPPVRETCR